MVKVPKGTYRVNRDGKHPPREWTIMLRLAEARLGTGEAEVGHLERRENSWRAFPAVFQPGVTEPWSDHRKFTDACQWLVDNYRQTRRAQGRRSPEPHQVPEPAEEQEPQSPPEDEVLEVTGPASEELDLDDLDWAAEPAQPAPDWTPGDPVPDPPGHGYWEAGDYPE